MRLPTTRDFFELLIHLKITLYSKYESNNKRRDESHMRAYFRPPLFSGSNSSNGAVKSTFSEMNSEG